jgi:HEAT repeat protein
LAALTDETTPTREAALQAAEAFYELANTDTQAQLVKRVAALGSDRIGALTGALASQNPAVRCAAATVLSWTRNPDIVEPLCRALTDEQSGDAAADALFAMAEVAAALLGPVAERLDGPGRKALYGLVLRVGSLPQDSAAALESSLIADLGRLDEDLAQAAAAALEVVGSSGAVRPLADLLAMPEQPDALVHTAASALGGLGLRHRDTVTAAVVSLGDSLPPMALGPLVSRMGGAEFLPLVRAALASRDVDARVSAVRALSGLKGLSEARSLVESALADFDPQVRAAAALLLGNFTDSRAQAAVPKALKDTDAQVRSAAARAAGRMGSTKSSPMLQALVMTDDSPAVAVEALEALRALGTEIPADVLKAALAHGDSEVVKAALRCAADLEGQTVDLDAVEAALRHQSWDVRLEAVRTISRCAESERARRALSALLETEADGLVRQVAQENLELVGEGRRS